MIKKIIRDKLLASALYQRLMGRFGRPAFSAHYSKHLQQFDKFCLFIGWGRTGSTLLGVLLNAHPQIALSEERLLLPDLLQLVKNRCLIKKDKTTRWVDFSLGREQLLGYLAKSAAARKPSRRSGYEYAISAHSPHSSRSQCTHLPIKVIGDKGSSPVARFFSQKGNLENFRQFNEHWRLNTHFVCVLRNPYDVITTMSLRRTAKKYPLLFPKSVANSRQLMEIIIEQGYLEKARSRLPRCIDAFAERCHGVQVLSDSGLFPIYFVYYADLTTHTRETISAVTEFLGVASSNEYLQACTGLVKPTSKTRFFAEQFWHQKDKDAVQAVIDKYPWLQRYTFDN